jgi:hypothetical protein
MVSWAARGFGINATEPEVSQVEFRDKGLDHSNRIVFANPVFQAFRKERGLPAIHAFNEASHMIPRIS